MDSLPSMFSMKRFLYSSTVASLVAALIVATSNGAPVAGQLPSAKDSIGKDQMLLAQADASEQKKTAANKKGPLVNVDKNGVILKGYDPVAYFKQSRAVKGSPKYSSKYEGATYYFASEEDKTEFEKTPAKYAPQYGGFCANSMRKRKLADIDPNQFFIYQGKLYVCTAASSLKEFSAKPDLNIQAADKNWDFYQPPSSPGFNRQFGS
jgi:YHS domain-containing protein